jgi:hypothetical protein
VVVWAGKLRELWDCLSELNRSVRESRLERDILCDGQLLNGLQETEGGGVQLYCGIFGIG